MTEVRPIVAQTAPIAMELREGESVWWCACGRSQEQPFCDGSHEGTGIEPLEFIAPRTKTYYLCCCKQTRKPPLCDGTHNTV